MNLCGIEFQRYCTDIFLYMFSIADFSNNASYVNAKSGMKYIQTWKRLLRSIGNYH